MRTIRQATAVLSFAMLLSGARPAAAITTVMTTERGY